MERIIFVSLVILAIIMICVTYRNMEHMTDIPTTETPSTVSSSPEQISTLTNQITQIIAKNSSVNVPINGVLNIGGKIFAFQSTGITMSS